MQRGIAEPVQFVGQRRDIAQNEQGRGLHLMLAGGFRQIAQLAGDHPLIAA
ncbi:hypothetical protein D3C87_2191770 [compost metagenome]